MSNPKEAYWLACRRRSTAQLWKWCGSAKWSGMMAAAAAIEKRLCCEKPHHTYTRQNWYIPHSAAAIHFKGYYSQWDITLDISFAHCFCTQVFWRNIELFSVGSGNHDKSGLLCVKKCHVVIIKISAHTKISATATWIVLTKSKSTKKKQQ